MAYALTHANSDGRWALKACAVLLAASLVHQLARPAAGADIKLFASVIQGGLPNWVYRQSSIDPEASAVVRERYLDVAEAEAADRLLILPEAAVREVWGEGEMTQAYRRLHQRGNGLLAGVNWYFDGALRNSAMIWPQGQEQPRFQVKRVAVPIVERVFEGLRAAAQVLPAGGSVMMCIESVYPRFVPPSSQWLLVLTNDAGVGRSAPRRAFERERRLRAIESGLSLVRAGQEGLTYVLGPDGSVLTHLKRYQPGVLRVDQVPGPRPTLRAWLGDWFWVLAWLLLAFELRRQLVGREPAESGE